MNETNPDMPSLDDARTPKPSTVRSAWTKAHPFWATTDVEERYAEFDRMIAAVRREEREKAAQIAMSEAGPSAETDAHGRRIAARVRAQGGD